MGVLLFGVFRVAIRFDPSPHHFLTDAVTGVLFVAYFSGACLAVDVRLQRKAPWLGLCGSQLCCSGRLLLLRRYFRQLWVQNGDDLVCPAPEHAGFGGLTIGRVKMQLLDRLLSVRSWLASPWLLAYAVRPLTIGSSDRGCRLRWGLGGKSMMGIKCLRSTSMRPRVVHPTR